MTTIFDGKAFSLQKEAQLAIEVDKLKVQGKLPRLDSIIVGDDPASIMYQNLKKKAADRIGAEVRIKVYSDKTSTADLISEIKKLNDNTSVSGIMVQLPLPANFSKNDRDKILNSISPDKDVDGLLTDSKFTPPTAKAVMEVLNEALKKLPVGYLLSVCVVGASGFEGRQIVKALKKKYVDNPLDKLKMKIHETNSKTNNIQKITLASDVVISVTGKPGLIKADMVQTGAILIDVGAPIGDIEREAYEKSDFVSPVPGGVGPITISCLLENLVDAAS